MAPSVILLSFILPPSFLLSSLLLSFTIPPRSSLHHSSSSSFHFLLFLSTSFFSFPFLPIIFPFPLLHPSFPPSFHPPSSFYPSSSLLPAGQSMLFWKLGLLRMLPERLPDEPPLPLVVLCRFQFCSGQDAGRTGGLSSSLYISISPFPPRMSSNLEKSTLSPLHQTFVTP